MDIKIERVSQVIDDRLDYNAQVFIITTDKKISVDNTVEIGAVLQMLISGGALKIIVDLKDLEFIDNNGITVLIDAVKNIRDQNGDILFTNMPSDLNGDFDGAKFKSFVKIYSSVVEAINKFRYIK